VESVRPEARSSVILGANFMAQAQSTPSVGWERLVLMSRPLAGTADLAVGNRLDRFVCVARSASVSKGLLRLSAANP
jgi:hypothetical protein